MLIFTGAMALTAVVSTFFKKTDVSVQQPVQVTITEELHKIFANKETVEKHFKENREDHDKIFAKIGGVERGGRDAVESKVETVRKDVVIVSNQVSALKAQTDSQNHQLNRIERTVSEMPGKIVADIVNAKKL